MCHRTLHGRRWSGAGFATCSVDLGPASSRRGIVHAFNTRATQDTALVAGHSSFQHIFTSPGELFLRHGTKAPPSPRRGSLERPRNRHPSIGRPRHAAAADGITLRHCQAPRSFSTKSPVVIQLTQPRHWVPRRWAPEAYFGLRGRRGRRPCGHLHRRQGSARGAGSFRPPILWQLSRDVPGPSRQQREDVRPIRAPIRDKQPW